MTDATRSSAPDFAFFHTAPALVETFNGLMAELAPDLETSHTLRPDLLSDALDAGALTDEIRRRAQEAIAAEAAGGATVLLCTCSTIGPGADDAARGAPIPVLRVDRPMAEQAVRIGRRIKVAASLDTTLPPTMDLLAEVAREAGKEVALTPVVFEAARAKFVAGDTEGYVALVAEGLRDAATGADVIVLAQASMAPALAQCGDVGIPILTSPRSGLEHALAVYHDAAAQ